MSHFHLNLGVWQMDMKILPNGLCLKKILFIYLFLERGREGESEGEKHQCERETSIDCLLRKP